MQDTIRKKLREIEECCETQLKEKNTKHDEKLDMAQSGAL